jgi:hypothetical protein
MITGWFSTHSMAMNQRWDRVKNFKVGDKNWSQFIEPFIIHSVTLGVEYFTDAILVKLRSVLTKVYQCLDAETWPGPFRAG